MKLLLCFLMCCGPFLSAQNHQGLPTIPKEQLLRDLELLWQGLDKHHTGMYWYTTRDSVQQAFAKVKGAIDRDLNELEFFNLVAPLVGLSREDHTDMRWSKKTIHFLREEATYLPLKVVFLNQNMYITAEGMPDSLGLIGQKVVAINGETPKALVQQLGELFASDGIIRAVKYSDLDGRQFALYYFIKKGFVEQYELILQDANGQRDTVSLKALKLKDLVWHGHRSSPNPPLQFTVLNDSTAYLAVHTFGGQTLRKQGYHSFLKRSFKKMQALRIQRLILDLSQNGGGKEGNENLLYSYLGDNYQKYHSVCAKSQHSVLDNGVDRPIHLRTFDWPEVWWLNTKETDGRYCRRPKIGHGLMAYRKAPRYRYTNKLYVLISPVTYSGGSELANMLYTQSRAIFVGEETGGGYRGNTSGYSSRLELPHSGLIIDIPTLQFDMNVQGGVWGRGVLPDYCVIPTIEDYLNDIPTGLNFILAGKAEQK